MALPAISDTSLRYLRIVVQLEAICCTTTEPLPLEDLMQACGLHSQEEEMTLDLLKDLTEVISINPVVWIICFVFASPVPTDTRARKLHIFSGLSFRVPLRWDLLEFFFASP